MTEQRKKEVLETNLALSGYGFVVLIWDKGAVRAVYHAVVPEEAPMPAWHTRVMNPASALDPMILGKHFERKHGKIPIMDRQQ